MFNDRGKRGFAKFTSKHEYVFVFQLYFHANLHKSIAAYKEKLFK